MSSWTIETVDLTHAIPPGLCGALLGSEVAIVRVIGIPATLAAAALAEIGAATVTTNTYSNATLHTVGPYLARGLSNLPDYFSRAGELDKVFGSQSADPRLVVRNAVRRAIGLTSLDPLRELDGRRYAEAVVRLHRNGAANPLHNDLIARDAASSGLRVAAAVGQLSAVYCLQECTAGGELVHYRRQWRPEDERHKVAGRLGYNAAIVEGTPAATFRPQANDLYVMDPRNYHEILPVSGRTRVTMGSFILTFEDEPSCGWSIA